MQKNRCIYCMEERNSAEMTCPNCKKSFWEYQWQEHWMHPYTRLKERYLIGAVIRESAYSITYQAYDQLLLRRVIVKEFFPREDCEKRQNFLEEAKMLFGKYDLVGMPAVTDVLDDNGTVCFVMEFLPGISLKEYLSKQPKGRIEVQEAIRLLMPVMETLTFWHSEGLLHGAVTMDNLLFDENGICRLIGWGNSFSHMHLSAGSDFEKTGNVPECFGMAEKSGPWSDVYGLGSVFYECITGKSLKEVLKGRKKDRVRPLSDYIDVDLRVERAVLQSLEPQIQRRFFCVGTFLEHLGGDGTVLAPYTGAIQAKWGERWLSITTEAGIQNTGRARAFLTRRQKKRIVKTAAVVTAVCALAAGGLYAYVKTHPEQVLAYKIRKDYEYDEERPVRMLVKGDTGYEGILSYTQKNGEEKEYDNGIYYGLTRADYETAQIESNRLEKFPLRKEQLKELMCQCLGVQCVNEEYTAYQVGAFLNTGRLGRLDTDGYDLIQYDFSITDSNASMEIMCDITDQRVVSLGVQYGFGECKKVLLEILPVLAPEMYLTEEEAEEMLVLAKEDGSFYYDGNARYDLSIIWHEDSFSEEEGDGFYDLTLRRYKTQDTPRTDENGEAYHYAGNYVRGSQEYEEYLNFVKENALEITQDGDTTVYELDREAAFEWGLPSNINTIPVKKGKLLNEIEDRLSDGKEPEEKDGYYYVYEEPYGVLRTEFFVVESYVMGEAGEQTLILHYDPISEYLIRVYVYDQQNRSEILAEKSADIAMILSKDISEHYDWDEEYESFKNAIDRYMTEEGLSMGGYYADCSFVISYDGDSKYCFNVFVRYGYPVSLFEEENYAPYYWPDY